jgi:hypothetical protein
MMKNRRRESREKDEKLRKRGLAAAPAASGILFG